MRPIRTNDYDPAYNNAHSEIEPPHGSPDNPARTHESQWGKTQIANHLEAVDDNTTQFISCSNVSFKGIMKFMPLFFPRSIRKRSEADLSRFELLVESEAAGSPS